MQFISLTLLRPLSSPCYAPLALTRRHKAISCGSLALQSADCTAATFYTVLVSPSSLLSLSDQRWLPLEASPSSSYTGSVWHTGSLDVRGFVGCHITRRCCLLLHYTFEFNCYRILGLKGKYSGQVTSEPVNCFQSRIFMEKNGGHEKLFLINCLLWKLLLHARIYLVDFTPCISFTAGW